MPSFKGQYEHSVDSKGRVSFPAKLRKSLTPEAQERFTILRGVDPCLQLYPADEWQMFEKRLSNINSFSEEGRTVKRHLLRYAEDISLDNQNRIALPSQLMEYAGIEDKAIFIGSVEYVEIWSPDKLAEEDSEISDEMYQELFERVMGDDDIHDQT